MSVSQATHPASWLRVVRECVGLSQTELGKLTSRTQAQISRYEDGSRIPPQDVAERIGEALGVDGERLFSDTEPSPQDVIRKHLTPPGQQPDHDTPDLTELDIANVILHMSGPQQGTVEYVDKTGRAVAYHTAGGRFIRLGARGLHRQAARRTPQGTQRPRARRSRKVAKQTTTSGNDDPPGSPKPASGLPRKRRS